MPRKRTSVRPRNMNVEVWLVRIHRRSVWALLFFYLFALTAPVQIAWAGSDDAIYEDMSYDDGSSDFGDEDDDGMSTKEIIGAVVGTVVGGIAGVALGPFGLAGGGALGFFLGKWIGQKFTEKSLSDRASDGWEDVEDRWDSDKFPGKYWWKDRYESHNDWWRDRWHDWEDRWDSDKFPGKYWWKDRWSDAKFWEDDDDSDEANSPASSGVALLRSKYLAAQKAFLQALKDGDEAQKKSAREAYEKAQKAYYEGKAAALK